MNNIQSQRASFLENGYDPIPLKPNNKKPVSYAWQTKPTFTQWQYARGDVNIGLRAGYGRAFIDADDKNQPGTFETITKWLEGLGHVPGSYPVVQTPNHGAHIYINFTGDMMGDAKKLKPDIGAGEFRYGSGAYVAAFPSVIPEGQYKLISGDIAQLPEMGLRDIAMLVNVNQEAQPAKPKKMSRLALAIANGTKPDKYATASEGEAALVLSLINSGYTYEEIKHIFNKFPCLGHYRQKHAGFSAVEGERWLYMTYKNALEFSQRESPVRRKIAQFIERAKTAAWRNANRKEVFLAHLGIAYKAGKFEYVASSRDVALQARLSRVTAMSQTAKLVDAELLAVKTPGSIASATVYSLPGLGTGKDIPLPKNTICEEVVQVSQSRERESMHDAFRNGAGKFAKGRLGRRAGGIYELLLNNSLSIAEIVKATDADWKTVKTALNKMHKFIDPRTGEIIEMVSRDEAGRWHSNIVNLDTIAAIVKTFAATGKQRLTYERERRAHARSLELGALHAKSSNGIVDDSKFQTVAVATKEHNQ